MKQFFTSLRRNDDTLRDNRWIFISMLIGAIGSLIASFVLSLEAFQLAKDPNAVLSCSVNVVLNCATVAAHPTSELFGFPNPFLGMIAEPVVITVAIAGLAGVKFPRLFMFAAQIGYTLGFIFAWVLFYISFTIIQALCPWCLLVTLTTTLVWFAITRYNIREGNLFLPAAADKRLKEWIKRDYDKLVLWSLIAASVAAIVLKYGDGLFA